MKPFDVAYGVPDRSVSEAQLRAALARVVAAFDESPTRMHVVLGPPGQGVRWFSFACTVFGRETGLPQWLFAEAMAPELPELFLCVRNASEEPGYFETRGAHDLRIVRIGDAISVAPGLPATARRDGEIDEIALAALDLPSVRPFVVLAAPTHEVVLRGDDVDPAYPIVPLVGPALPIRVTPRYGAATGEGFTRAAHSVDASDVAAHVDRVLANAEGESVGAFEGRLHLYARDIVRAGPTVAPSLVDRLGQPKAKPRSARIAMTALGILGAEARAIVPWVAKSSLPLQLAAFCALARQGEAARPALVTARGSKKTAERVAAQALLQILDAAEWAPLRALRAARDALTEAEVAPFAPVFAEPFGSPDAALLASPARFAWFLRAAIAEKESNQRCEHALRLAPDDAIWAVALVLVECPIAARGQLGNDLAGDGLVRAAVRRFGAAFGPIADLLLRFPPLAEHLMLGPIAAGKPVPTSADLLRKKPPTADKKR